jgi:hypothetical protein
MKLKVLVPQSFACQKNKTISRIAHSSRMQGPWLFHDMIPNLIIELIQSYMGFNFMILTFTRPGSYGAFVPGRIRWRCLSTISPSLL